MIGQLALRALPYVKFLGGPVGILGTLGYLAYESATDYWNRPMETITPVPIKPRNQATSQTNTAAEQIGLRRGINWEALAKVFSDPRATPGFYELAFNYLINYMNNQRALEQAMLKSALTPQIGIKDYVDITKNILDTIEKYPLIQDETQKALISKQLGIQLQLADQMYKSLLQQAIPTGR